MWKVTTITITSLNQFSQCISVVTRVISPPNSNTGGSHLIFSVPFSYFLFIFKLPWFTLPDFSSVSSLASLPFSLCRHRTTASFTFPDAPYHIFFLFLPWHPCHFYHVVIEQQQQQQQRKISPIEVYLRWYGLLYDIKDIVKGTWNIENWSISTKYWSIFVYFTT